VDLSFCALKGKTGVADQKKKTAAHLKKLWKRIRVERKTKTKKKKKKKKKEKEKENGRWELQCGRDNSR